MGGFTAGLVTGCLLGVCGTFLMLSLGAAFSMDRAKVFQVRSLPGTLLSSIVLLFIAAFCHRLSIGKDASMLMLLLAVLVISRLEGLLNGLIATAIGALILAWIFPPDGSVMIKSSSDRLALALFLLIATLGSRLLARRESSAPQS
jgi:K+-sensing histidine kinase KdpD